MPIVEVLVPQMGEGLQEVFIVGFQKQPGERIRRDETIYSMETDKATMEVESPHDCVLVEWLAREGDTGPWGAPFAGVVLSEGGANGAGSGGGQTIAASPIAALSNEKEDADLRERSIPPRTRAYAREKGLSDDKLARVPQAGSKLMPADVDAYLESGGTAPPPAPVPVAPPVAESPTGEFAERALSQQDRTFIYRLKRSATMVVPATAKRQMDWDAIRQFADRKKQEIPDLQPSTFQCVAWCIARAVSDHPKFRSSLVREDTVREFANLNLGIAVAIPTGELTIAVVRAADSLPFEAFVRTAQQRIQEARGGDDQADEATHLLLTYMGPYEVTDAVPVLVAPAAAVLFIGSPFEQGDKQVVNLALTFDHRLIHGVEAAEFLRAIVHNAAHIEELAR